MRQNSCQILCTENKLPDKPANSTETNEYYVNVA
jgi:hypothetical protein